MQQFPVKSLRQICWTNGTMKRCPYHSPLLTPTLTSAPSSRPRAQSRPPLLASLPCLRCCWGHPRLDTKRHCMAVSRPSDNHSPQCRQPSHRQPIMPPIFMFFSGLAQCYSIAASPSAGDGDRGAPRQSHGHLTFPSTSAEGLVHAYARAIG